VVPDELIPWLPVVALAATPFALAMLRRWPRAMCVVALAACVLPFLLPLDQPFLRASAAVASWVALIKTFECAAGREKPANDLVDFLLYLVIPTVVRWETPRQRDARRIVRTLLTSLMQLSIAVLLVVFVLNRDPGNALQLFTAQFCLYFALAGAFNLVVVPLAVRGLDYDDPFDNPLASRTPGEFWGRRWNTWVNHLLYRYIFVPMRGRHHPVRGTLAAFAFSGAFHEVIVAVGTLSFSGWMFAFFMVQGVLVVATLHWKSFRRLAKRAPVLTWALTVLLMLSTGVMFVRGADGIDPSNTWHQVSQRWHL